MTNHSRNRASRRPRIIAVLATAVSLWLVAPAALAQAGDPVKSQYDNSITQVSGNVGGGGTDAATAPSGLQKKVVGGLPFTGLDVVALAAVAIALTSIGFALRRLTADRHLS
jgi:hypothetical protein